MVLNAGHQTPLTLLLRSHDLGDQVSQQKDLRLSGEARQGLFHPTHLRLFIGWYVHPYYRSLLPPRHQHKPYHTRAVIIHPPDLPSLLPPPYNGNVTPVFSLCLYCPYGVASDLIHVHHLCQICLL